MKPKLDNKRKYRVQFLRKPIGSEKPNALFEYFVVDDAYLTCIGTDEAMILGDLINKFNAYVEQFGYEDVSVANVYEVKEEN